MKVSVVVRTYSMEWYESFSETVESVLTQTYKPLELVTIIDGNEGEFDCVQDDFGNIDDIVLYCNDGNRGISYNWTKGAKFGTGSVVAMVNDNATAEPDWIETLINIYKNNPGAVAASGIVVPDWVVCGPEFFPEEFYWLAGYDERGFDEHTEKVQNTCGSNISFKHDVFFEAGNYDANISRKGDKHVRAHEVLVRVCIYEQMGEHVIYNKQVRASYRPFEYRTKFDWLVFRSFWWGYSKRVMNLSYPQASDDKNAYLKDLMLVYVVDRLKNLAEDPSLTQVQQLVTIFVFTAAVEFGYVYGLLTPNLVEKTNNWLAFQRAFPRTYRTYSR